jgi:hypothetical protein
MKKFKQFYSVSSPVKIGGAAKHPAVCYPLTDGVAEAVAGLADKGLAKIYDEEVRFVSGRALPAKRKAPSSFAPLPAFVPESVPIAEETATETPATTETPAAEEAPAAEETATETPVAETSAAEETPATEEAPAETPVAETPATEETLATEEAPAEEAGTKKKSSRKTE